MTTDHLGSPRVVTDENGAVVDRKDYTAFGEENYTPERVAGLGYSAADELRKGYTGYEKDGESGLDFAQARYYKAAHGRFTSVDPLTASASIRNPQTFNRYSYVLNSPYKFTDPLGLLPVGWSDSYGFCGADNSSCSNTPNEWNYVETVPAPEQEETDEGIAENQVNESGEQQQTQEADPPPIPSALTSDETKILRINLQDPNNLLSSDNLAAMKSELSSVYNEIDVEVVFTDVNPDYTLSVQQDRTGFSASENAVGSTPANLGDKTVSNYGYVFINQATTAINSTSAGKTAAGRDSKALGRAGSHEIAHYLLQQIEHSTSGVMKKSFNGDEWFTKKTLSLWQFNGSQKMTIRSKLPDKELKK